MSTSPSVLTRRALLASGSAFAVLAAVAPAWPQDRPATPFSFDALTDAARQRAEAPDPEAPPLDPLLAQLSYDDYQRIVFRPDRAVFATETPGWQVQPFHTGWLFDRAVRLHEVHEDRARPMDFTTRDFEYRDGLSVELPADFALPGVAGFRLNWPLNRADQLDEVLSFLGASYFRALGAGNRYGLSARGLAIDTVLPVPEEFPRFSEFWIERPVLGAPQITLWAAMDSARVTGAWRFVVQPGATTVMEVTARLFFREEVTQLGIAPLVSMFLFGGVNRGGFDDFRPQVHDSDGLRIERADGDVVWRALNNPAELASSYFAETRPRRFGLHQRSRRFDDFADAEARYELRPSLDVEPVGDWGSGQIRLFEIPTDLEVHDNIGAFWIPDAPVVPGEMFEVAYRLHWGMLDPDPDDDLAWVAHTSAGVGGAAGMSDPPDTRKFVVDFQGGILGRTPEGNQAVTPVVNVAGGTAEVVVLSKLPDAEGWRLAMDIAAGSGDLVEINAHIAGSGRKLSEIWTFQWKKP
ncbi:glucan biosynthesis protein [Roseicitreum antarcticum]|uniref:Glucans biosynthesis protein G n=1 Tax=Roseicitreum antarcticum TaxID=564137 RepID=A0A1H2TQZ6_9RHOB|nr:glucan biosynthesis protein G [Roseicitreum antarcticum]SDW46310.1 glucans biosynthesis protein [Roseicitreum antarcticum]